MLGWNGLCHCREDGFHCFWTLKNGSLASGFYMVTRFSYTAQSHHEAKALLEKDPLVTRRGHVSTWDACWVWATGILRIGSCFDGPGLVWQLITRPLSPALLSPSTSEAWGCGGSCFAKSGSLARGWTVPGVDMALMRCNISAGFTLVLIQGRFGLIWLNCLLPPFIYSDGCRAGHFHGTLYVGQLPMPVLPQVTDPCWCNLCLSVNRGQLCSLLSLETGSSGSKGPTSSGSLRRLSQVLSRLNWRSVNHTTLIFYRVTA